MENFALIALFVTIGIFFRRLDAFPQQTTHVLNMFALYVSLPAVILLKVPQISFSEKLLTPITIAWLALILSALLILFLGRVLNWERSATGVLLLVVPLGNTSFMGVPIINAFFGEAGLRHLIVYDQFGTMLIFATYGSLILAIYGKERGVTIKGVIKRAVLFPPSLAMGAGIAMLPWHYHPLAERLLQIAAGTLTPLVMTAIGFQLTIRMHPSLKSPLWLGMGIKLFLAPLIVLLICRGIGLRGLPVDVSIIESGMPPMVTAGALAVIAGMNAELSTALVGLGLLISFATLPLFYFLTQI